MKKKVIASLLSVALTLSMSMAVYAAEGSTTVGNAGSQDIDVMAKYTDSTNTEPLYSVDITWEDMTFTYRESGAKTWQPSDHTYRDETTAGWDKTTAKITVTNHSNAAVEAGFQYADNGISGVTGILDVTSADLAAGVENKPAEADSKAATLTISGKPDSSTVTSQGVKIGTVTVTVSGK